MFSPSQSSGHARGSPSLAIDGRTSGDYKKDRTCIHTEAETNPYWKAKFFGSPDIVKRIYNRRDCCSDRLIGAEAIIGGEVMLKVASSAAVHTSDPFCYTGLKAGSACCAKSCGICGGSGCSLRPGGFGSCCVGKFTSGGQSCLSVEAPCALP